MTTKAQKTAKPPVSPHANLTSTARTGTTDWGSAIWQVVCSCGEIMTADASVIRRGLARCSVCNPRICMVQANKILAALPATHSRIERKTKLTYGQIEYRLDWMRERDMCHVGDWDRATYQGSFNPIFHAGAGEDVPCNLKPQSAATRRRKYAKRIKKAIQAAEESGKIEGRYMRSISLHIAAKTARNARKQPQGWASALFVAQVSGGGLG